jgi:hypothetical protein
MTTTDTTKPKSLRALVADATEQAARDDRQRDHDARRRAIDDRDAHAKRLATSAALVAKRWGVASLADAGAWTPGPPDVDSDFPDAYATRIRYVWARADGVTLRCDGLYRAGYEHLVLVRRCAKPEHDESGGEHTADIGSLVHLGQLLKVDNPAEDSQFTACGLCAQEREDAALAAYEAREAEREAVLPPPVVAPAPTEPGAAEGLPRSVALAESARMLNVARKLALVDDDGLPVITASPDSYNALYAALALGYGLATYAQACEAHVTGELEAQVQGSVHTESGY